MYDSRPANDGPAQKPAAKADATDDLSDLTPLQLAEKAVRALRQAGFAKSGLPLWKTAYSELQQLREASTAAKPVSAQLRSAEDKLKNAEVALTEASEAVLQAQEALQQAMRGHATARLARDDASRACAEISALAAAAREHDAPAPSVAHHIATAFGLEATDPEAQVVFRLAQQTQELIAQLRPSPRPTRQRDEGDAEALALGHDAPPGSQLALVPAPQAAREPPPTQQRQ